MAQTVFITGAVGGIGRSLCQVFKDKDYFVVASDRIGAYNVVCDDFVQADLEQFCQVSTYRDQIMQEIRDALQGRELNALINNAAIQIVKATDDLTVGDWHTSLDVNLVAPFLLTQQLLPELEKASGAVVNIASIHAQLTKPEFVCYATSKAALVGLTKSLAVDLGPRIRVNAICPAAVETPMLLAGFEGDKNALKNLASMHPMNRIARTEEIADVAVFLVSGMSNFMTGEVLNICGGIDARLHDPV